MCFGGLITSFKPSTRLRSKFYVRSSTPFFSSNGSGRRMTFALGRSNDSIAVGLLARRSFGGFFGFWPFGRFLGFTSSTRVLNYFPVAANKIFTRNFELSSTTLLIMTKILATISTMYFIIRWAKNSSPSQYFFILLELSRNKRFHLDSIIKPFDRYQHLSYLKRIINGTPSGITLICGPIGSGRSTLVRSLLNDRRMIISVDFDCESITTSEEFIWSFVTNSGYAVSQQTEFMRIFTREEERKAKITPQEAEKSLDLIFRCLKFYDRLGLSLTKPVIFIDNADIRVHMNPSDMHWNRFLNWLFYVSDMKLAHVIISVSNNYNIVNPLLNNTTFRSKCMQLFVHYPALKSVEAYLVNLLQQYSDADPQATARFFTMLLGGNFNDLVLAFQTLKVGESIIGISRRIISDGIIFFENCFERILSLESVQSKEDVYKRYLRLWATVELLDKKVYIHRKILVQSIFEEYSNELSEYIDWGLFSYEHSKSNLDPTENNRSVLDMTKFTDWVEKTLKYQSEEGKIKHRPFKQDIKSDSMILETFLKKFSEEAEIPRERTTSEGHSQDNEIPKDMPEEVQAQYMSFSDREFKIYQKSFGLSEDHLKLSEVMLDPMKFLLNLEYPTSKPNFTNENKDGKSLLDDALDGLYVTPASPKMRMVFSIVLKDKRFIQRKTAIENELKLQSLNEKIENMENIRKELIIEKQSLITELEAIDAKKDIWKWEYGPNFFHRKKVYLFLQESGKDEKLFSIAQDIIALENERNACEAMIS